MNTVDFKTVNFDDGQFSVVRMDRMKPQYLEVIATFYDLKRAQDYIDLQAAKLAASPSENSATSNPEPNETDEEEDLQGLSPHQSSALHALRYIMDKRGMVAVANKDLCKAANIKAGSLATVLNALEAKGLIKILGTGSYQLLKRAPVANGKYESALAGAH
jgi:hypothetical protein